MRVYFDDDDSKDDYWPSYEYIFDADASDTIDEAVARLDAIKERSIGDNAHLVADAVLMSMVPAAVLDAYRRVMERETFHYS